jgi:ribosomal protein S18 acetylase RimI-like enzyme
LLAAAEGHARARGARTLYIGVLAANAGAAELYRKVGFRPYSELLIKTL